MATDITIDLATLRFDVERFKGHALDVECTHDHHFEQAGFTALLRR